MPDNYPETGGFGRQQLLSGDWEAYWAFHKQKEMQRTHAARYAGDVPDALRGLESAA